MIIKLTSPLADVFMPVQETEKVRGLDYFAIMSWIMAVSLLSSGLLTITMDQSESRKNKFDANLSDIRLTVNDSFYAA